MTASVIVNIPPQKVFILLIDPAFYREWKKDFVGFEPAGGAKCEVGSVHKLAFKRSVMIETIDSKNAPHEFSATYRHMRGDRVQMVHRVTNRFTPTPASGTRIDSDMEIVEVHGFFLKIMMSVFAGAGAKYAQAQLEQFRKFAESV
jgi:uncharacterized protein YndB with AHSA1/START domain